MRSTFTQQTQRAILTATHAGLTRREAAQAAGVPLNTLNGWLARGRKETGTPHALFAADIDAARVVIAAAPMDELEFLGHLNTSVRAGSVQAMKLWWEVHRADRSDEQQADDPFASFTGDELARRRAG